MKFLPKLIFTSLITLLFAPQNGKAQSYTYHPFNMDSAVWYIETIHQNSQNFPPTPTHSYERYFFNGDTIIDTLKHYKLYVDFTNMPLTPNGVDGFWLYRQDTIQRKIYQRFGIIQGIVDTLYYESVVYNFNWQIGDTIKPDSNPDSICNIAIGTCPIIINIDSTYIFGKFRKRFAYIYYQGSATLINYIYDGLGFNLGFNGWAYYEEAGFNRYLFCYSDNAPNHYVDSCQNEMSLILSTQNIKQTKSNNILSNKLVTENLEFNETLINFTIYDLFGNIIYIGTNQKYVNVSNLSNGIYILRANKNYTEKFIINHL